MDSPIFRTTFTFFLLLSACNITIAQLHYTWAHQGGGNGLDQAYAVTVDNSGNVYATGVYEGDAVFTPNPGPGDTLYHTAMSDAFVVKYNAAGSYEWAIRIIGDLNFPGNQNQIPYDIATDNNGNVYITGRIDSKSDFDPSDATADTLFLHPDDGTAYIAKYDPNGQLIWARNFGGPTYVQGTSLSISKDGWLYLHGYFNGTADFDPGPGMNTRTTNGGYDIYLGKFNLQGDLQWINSFGGAGSDFAADIEINKNGSVFMCSRYENTVDFDPGSGTASLTSAGGSDIAIALYSSSGNLIWVKDVKGTNTEYIFDIALDSNDNFAITGYFDAVTDFDPSSSTVNLTPAGGQDAFIAHYNGNGDLNWVSSPSNASNDAGHSVCFNKQGDVLLAGNFQGSIDLDTRSGSAVFTASQSDEYIAQYDSLGNFIWGGTFGGPSFDFVNEAASDTAGNLYLAGGFVGPNADMDPDTTRQTMFSGLGSFDAFIAKLGAGFGCPSIIDTNKILICAGDSVLFGGQYYQQQGFHTDTLVSANGCDSILTLELKHKPVSLVTIDSNLAPGDSIFFNGGFISEAGTYTDTLTAANGCDSIITMNISTIGITNNYGITNLQVWPNPANNLLHIDNAPVDGILRIIDPGGRYLLVLDPIGESAINLQGLKPGLYLLQILSKKDEAMIKLIVE